MALFLCPTCHYSVSDASPACSHCGRPVRGANGALAGAGARTNAAPAEPLPFFPVATHKFIVLSICTVGLYQLYWYYKNWQRVKAATGEDISPFWRAFFAQFWSFSLFGRIHDRALRDHLSVDWSPGFLGAAFFALTAAWRLPGAWWLIGIGSFLPMLPPHHAAKRINAAHDTGEELNTSYSGWNIATILVGGLFFLLAVIGSFMPE